MEDRTNIAVGARVLVEWELIDGTESDRGEYTHRGRSENGALVFEPLDGGPSVYLYVTYTETIAVAPSLGVQAVMQRVYSQAILDDIVLALDATEQALRTIEVKNALSAGLDQGLFDEAHKLIASSYERLCVARQIFQDAAQRREP